MNIASFDQAKRAYELTTPIKSHLHTLQDDIVPLGRRARKWERITKISRNKYALCSGYADATWTCKRTEVDGVVEYRQTPNKCKREIEQMCAILWERKKDGDYIHIRNFNGTSAAISHYEFLRSYIPYSMNFYLANGKQYVNGNYLPKNQRRTNNIREYLKDGVNTYYAKYYKARSTKELVFKHTVSDAGFNRYTLVSTPHKEPFPVVDKDTKAKYSSEIKQFKNWFLAMIPFLPSISRWSAEGRAVSANPIGTLRKAVAGDEDAMVALGAVTLSEIDMGRREWSGYEPVTIELANKRFNTTINKILELNIVEYR